MDSIFAGAIVLVRRTTTCLVLLALVGIYAIPLAAAFSPNAMDCCAAGMCPRPGRSSTHRQAHHEMPDCGTGSQTGLLRKCEMGACETQKDNVLSVGFFVLFAPAGIVRSPMQVPVLAAASQTEHSVSQIPETPPPRTSPS